MTEAWYNFNMHGLLKPPPGHPLYSPDPEPPVEAIDEEEKPAMAGTAAAKYQELRNKIIEARKTMEATAKGLFSEMTTELFNDNPTLAMFSWTQYTPYFNDGDECIFRCHGDYPSVGMIVNGEIWDYNGDYDRLRINGKEPESSEDLVDKFKRMGVDSFTKGGKNYAYDAKTGTVTIDGVAIPSYEGLDKQFGPLEEAVSAFMKNFANEDMKMMFGDHVEVTVNRDGTITKELHEHD